MVQLHNNWLWFYVNAKLWKSTKISFQAASILINCAGICAPVPLAEMTEQKFDGVLEVNLKVGIYVIDVYVTLNSIRHCSYPTCILVRLQGTFLMGQALAKIFTTDQKCDHGAIVNISSVAGKARKLYARCIFASKHSLTPNTSGCYNDSIPV